MVAQANCPIFFPIQNKSLFSTLKMAKKIKNKKKTAFIETQQLEKFQRKKIPHLLKHNKSFLKITKIS